MDTGKYYFFDFKFIISFIRSNRVRRAEFKIHYGISESL